MTSTQAFTAAAFVYLLACAILGKLIAMGMPSCVAEQPLVAQQMRTAASGWIRRCREGMSRHP